MREETIMRRSKNNIRHSRRVRSGGTYLTRSVVLQLGGITEVQLAQWEYEEFLTPAAQVKIEGHSEPVYDQTALRRIRTIRTLADELGVNLPGIGVVLHLLDQLESR